MAAPKDVQVQLPTLDQIIPPAQRKALLAHIALLAVGRIKRRTNAGLDVNGQAFKPYSRRYATMRRKAGRTVTPVTLWLSGGMLGGMQVVSSDENRAVIGFVGSSAAQRLSWRTKTTVKPFLFGTTQTTIRRVSVKNRKTGERITHKFSETGKQVSNALKARWNDRGEGKVPRRHFFGLSSEDRYFLARTALRELLRMAGQVYLGRAVRKR